ncbi:uncharacterized protein LOC121972920 [Zingiber officinale]|uniref:uncharacterized protein LOC121972920 n=1 Tax=Zingiber officinale TaxID=94328 RepID=UPI001C4AA5AD|nr:uncharacterized protein LOC121972920 [Zingiber officinale]
MKNIMKIPSEYILKRWTRKAKDGYIGVIDLIANKDSLDPKACTNLRYKELSGLYVQLVTKAAEREDTYKVVKDGLLSMFKMVDERLQVNEPIAQHSIEREFEIGEGNSLGVKGIKTKKKTISGLSMAETQFPPLLSTQLSQVHSDNDYFQTNNREGWCFNGVDVATMECTSTKEHHKE